MVLNKPVYSKILTAWSFTLVIIGLFQSIASLGKIKWLNYCGQHSLEIYVLHCFITAANRKILFKLGIENFVFNVLINFIMAVLIPLAAGVFLKKTGLYNYVFKFPFQKQIGNKR